VAKIEARDQGAVIVGREHLRARFGGMFSR
jgi:hypothetical protein